MKGTGHGLRSKATEATTADLVEADSDRRRCRYDGSQSTSTRTAAATIASSAASCTAAARSPRSGLVRLRRQRLGSQDPHVRLGRPGHYGGKAIVLSPRDSISPCADITGFGKTPTTTLRDTRLTPFTGSSQVRRSPALLLDRVAAFTVLEHASAEVRHAEKAISTSCSQISARPATRATTQSSGCSRSQLAAAVGTWPSARARRPECRLARLGLMLLRRGVDDARLAGSGAPLVAVPSGEGAERLIGPLARAGAAISRHRTRCTSAATRLQTRSSESTNLTLFADRERARRSSASLRRCVRQQSPCNS